MADREVSRIDEAALKAAFHEYQKYSACRPRNEMDRMAHLRVGIEGYERAKRNAMPRDCVERVARAIADAHREFDDKPPFTNEEWGGDFWHWYQRGDNNSPVVRYSWPSKLDASARAAIAVMEREPLENALNRIYAIGQTVGDPSEAANRMADIADEALIRYRGRP